jgi:hypothetical protein
LAIKYNGHLRYLSCSNSKFSLGFLPRSGRKPVQRCQKEYLFVTAVALYVGVESIGIKFRKPPVRAELVEARKRPSTSSGRTVSLPQNAELNAIGALNGAGSRWHNRQKQHEREKNMDYQELTAPCGIPCFECVVYKASTDETLKKRIAAGIGMDEEKCHCFGCRSRGGKGFLAEKNKIFPEGKCALLNEKGICKIYLCTKSQNIHNCSECQNFPCDKLQPVADRASQIPHNLKIYNLALIKKMGLAKWAEEKAAVTMHEYKHKKLDA